jgi:hypothetical protein
MRTRRTAGMSFIVAIAVLLAAGVATAGTQSTHGTERGSQPDSNAGESPSYTTTGSTAGGVSPCGEPVTSGSGPDGTVAYAACPGEPPTPVEPKPQIVTPTPGMADVSARSFDTATIGDDDRTLRIDFWAGIAPCDVLDHVAVSFGQDAVTVTLFSGHDPSADDVACIDIARDVRVVVTLDEPLDGRTIVDGALHTDAAA